MTSIRFIIANILVVLLSILISTTTSALVPINAGPSLDAKKAKIAGIGGVDGIKEIKMGGIGSFKVKGSANKKKLDEKKKKVVQKSKNRQPMGYRSANANWDGSKNKKNSKPMEKKKEEKKVVGGGFKMPWSK